MALDITTATQAQEHLDRIDRARGNVDRRAGMLTTRAYCEGDHWQRGEAWGGPPIDPAMVGAGETYAALQKDLVPVPIVPEVIWRQVSGVLGHEPAFAVELQRELQEGEQPTQAETDDVQALNDALTAFWDGCGAHEKAQEFASLLCMGRGVLRFLIPPEVAANLQAPGLNEAARAFDIDTPEWKQAGVLRDAGSGRCLGLYRYDEAYSLNGTVGAHNRAEVSFLNEAGETVFRTIENEVVTSEPAFDCNGRLWILQATLPHPLIDEPQRALQRKIDFLNYILPKNAQYAGFRERHFLGVARPVDPITQLPVDPDIGPATVNYWQPTYITDNDGNQRPSAASLVLSEPVNSQPIRDDIAHLTQVLLKSCNQLHTVISGDATASAVSRIQARAEFTASLLQLRPKVERVLRDLLELVLCMACNLAGEAALLERYKRAYRLRVDCRLDAGPISPEEKTAIIGLKTAGLISLETAMQMLGIEDTGSEMNRLKEEEMAAFSDGFPAQAASEVPA